MLHSPGPAGWPVFAVEHAHPEQSTVLAQMTEGGRTAHLGLGRKLSTEADSPGLLLCHQKPVKSGGCWWLAKRLLAPTE